MAGIVKTCATCGVKAWDGEPLSCGHNQGKSKELIGLNVRKDAPTPSHHVVYWCEHLRDGIEDGARVVGCVAEGLALIDKLANGFSGSNCEFRLFELGRELTLSSAEIHEPQPAKSRRKFAVE